MKPLTKKRHFVFDFDDTIADSYAFNQQSFLDMFAPYLDISDIKIEKYIRNMHYMKKGTSMYEQFYAVIEHFDLLLNPQDLLDASEVYHQERLPDVDMFANLREFLLAMKKRGMKISVCSNREKGSLMKVMNKQELVHVFDNIISCSEKGHEKPDPFCLLELIEEDSKNPDEFLFFGDSPTDVEFAHAAGVDFMIVDHYQNERQFYRILMEAFL